MVEIPDQDNVDQRGQKHVQVALEGTRYLIRLSRKYHFPFCHLKQIFGCELVSSDPFRLHHIEVTVSFSLNIAEYLRIMERRINVKEDLGYLHHC